MASPPSVTTSGSCTCTSPATPRASAGDHLLDGGPGRRVPAGPVQHRAGVAARIGRRRVAEVAGQRPPVDLQVPAAAGAAAAAQRAGRRTAGARTRRPRRRPRRPPDRRRPARRRCRPRRSGAARRGRRRPRRCAPRPPRPGWRRCRPAAAASVSPASSTGPQPSVADCTRRPSRTVPATASETARIRPGRSPPRRLDLRGDRGQHPVRVAVVTAPGHRAEPPVQPDRRAAPVLVAQLARPAPAGRPGARTAPRSAGRARAPGPAPR